MSVRRVKYEFTLRLPAPRDWTYRWATDFRPSDLVLMGEQASRKITRLAPNLVLLTDTFRADPFDPRPGGRTVKEKLVHLYPDRYRWVSTHVSGPAKSSQFTYELFPRGRNACAIRFTGAQVETVRGKSSARTTAERARTLRREDSAGWRRFARAIAKEYGSRRTRGSASG